MTHIADDLLNEYLDQALNQIQRAELESHLNTCPACAARVNQLRVLFNEIDSLPDVKLERDLSSAVVAAISPTHRATFAPMLWLVFAVQAAIALIAFAIAAWLTLPLIQQALDVNLIVAQSTEILSVEWAAWVSATQTTVDQTLQALTQPLPIEVPTFTLGLLIAVVSILWAAGNGLLITSISRRRA